MLHLDSYNVEETRAAILKNIETRDAWALSERLMVGKQVGIMLESNGHHGSNSVVKACFIVNTICEEKALDLFEKTYTAWFQAIYSNFHSDESTRDICIYTLTVLLKECHERISESKKLVSLWTPKLESFLIKVILSCEKSDSKTLLYRSLLQILLIFPKSFKSDARLMDDFFSENLKTKEPEFLSCIVQFYKSRNQFVRFLSKLITTISFLLELCFENPHVTKLDGERFPICEDAVSDGAFAEAIRYIDVLQGVLTSPFTPPLAPIGILGLIKAVYTGGEIRIDGLLDELLVRVDRVMKTLFDRFPFSEVFFEPINIFLKNGMLRESINARISFYSVLGALITYNWITGEMKNQLFGLILDDFFSLMDLLMENKASTSRKRKLEVEESMTWSFSKRHEVLLISVFKVLEMIAHELDSPSQMRIMESLFAIIFSFQTITIIGIDRVDLEASLLKFAWSVLQSGSGLALACLPVSIGIFAKGLHHPHKNIRLLCRDLLSKSELLIHPRLPPASVKLSILSKDPLGKVAPDFPIKISAGSLLPQVRSHSHGPTNLSTGVLSSKSKVLVDTPNHGHLNAIELESTEPILSICTPKKNLSSNSFNVVGEEAEISRTKSVSPQKRLDDVTPAAPHSPLEPNINPYQDQTIQTIQSISNVQEKDIILQGDSDVEMAFPEILLSASDDDE